VDVTWYAQQNHSSVYILIAAYVPPDKLKLYACIETSLLYIFASTELNPF